jgi:molecular chaperone DnaK
VKIESELAEMSTRLATMRADDVSDEKYQFEERKRKMAQQLDVLLRENQAETVKQEYFAAKNGCTLSLKKTLACSPVLRVSLPTKKIIWLRIIGR